MTATLYVPYSNGDARQGFKYGKNLDIKSYTKMIVDQYNSHKMGVDAMVLGGKYGNNMAMNYFEKERRKYKQQTYYYQPVECRVFNIEGKRETIDELLEYYETGEKFVLIIALLNLSSADESGELESDVKAWMSECIKISNTNKMTEDEKIKSLSKKNLKLRFKETKSGAVLNNCKMIEVMSRNKFAVLVDSITFIKDNSEDYNCPS